MEPLRVRAWLRAPIYSEPEVPLDGVLLYQAMRERYGARIATLSGMPEDEDTSKIAAIELPLVKENPDSERWFYRCSFAVWPAHAVFGKSAWSKRINMTEMHTVNLGRATTVAINKGRYRSYHMPVYYVTARYVDWFAIGDVQEIRRLLGNVWAICKKQSQGYGRVMQWQIEEWPDDWSIRRGKELMRPVPVENAFDMNRVRLVGFRPPYWLRENQTICEVEE